MADQNRDQMPRIGLALSGGGSRAIAFHLGCLRALHDLGILQHIRVLSTVSGGSVIGALFAATDAPFQDFEQKVRELLRRGLTRSMIRTIFTTPEGVKAALCWSILAPINVTLILLSWAAWLFSFLASPANRESWRLPNLHAPLRRFASRTTILRRALDDDVFKGRRLHDLPTGTARLIINATELRTGSAFYFGSEDSGGWRFGKLAVNDITLAHAVAASAAYPLFLPALDEEFAFDRRDGTRRVERVILSDGGIYDNLGLAPLWPDRDPAVSINVEEIDTIICCRAGYGLRHDPPTQFFVARLKSAFAAVHDRAQNAAMKRLFELKESGKLRDFILPYLGQNDDRLKFAPADLVTKGEAYGYPTDFAAMEDHWIERLSKRGDQLTRALIAEHAPWLTNLPATPPAPFT